MSQTVSDLYDGDTDAFESDLEDARMQARSDWDEGFVFDMKARYEKYGERMYISASQHEQLLRIGGND